jgi:hypothetical protein
MTNDTTAHDIQIISVSTSEDDQEEINNKIQWQEVQSSKRKEVKKVQEIAETNNAVEINN